MTRFLCLAAAFGLAWSGGAAVAEPRGLIAGPVQAQLIRVLDGDTIEVRARIWPDHYVQTLVRLAGIDAPESRSRCAAEAERAAAARARLAALLATGAIQLYDVRYGKYAGRVVARVVTGDGRDAAAALLAENLVRPYGGGRRRTWCALRD